MSGAAPGARTPRWRALGAAGVLVASLGLSVAIAPTASAADVPLAAGEQASSKNMHLLANLPKSGAFADVSAYNSDLAFSGDHAFAGNYNGFTVYDIKNPRKTSQVVQVVCPGSQNDITVHGDLLFLSVDSFRSDDSCNSTQLTTAQVTAGTPYWEGIRIFDISNPAQRRVRQGRRDRLRVAHPHARPGCGPRQGGLPLRLARTTRTLRCRAASRRTTRSRSSRCL